MSKTQKSTLYSFVFGALTYAIPIFILYALLKQEWGIFVFVKAITTGVVAEAVERYTLKRINKK